MLEDDNMTLLEKKLNEIQDLAVEDFIKNKNKALLPFPCGFGKTIVALKVINKLKIPAVIFVEPKHIEKFEAEIDKWIKPELKHLVTLFKHTELSAKSAFKYNELKKKKPQLLITDEVHNFKELQTTRGRRWSKLSKWKSVKYHMQLSATPVTNSVSGIYTVLKACNLVGADMLIKNKQDFILDFFYCIRVQIERLTILKPTNFRNSTKKQELLEIIKKISLVTKVRDIFQYFPKIVYKPIEHKTKTIEVNKLTLGERARYFKDIAPSRLTAFEGVLDKLTKDTRCVIYYRHENLGLALAEKYNTKVIGGKTSVANRNKLIKEFNNKDKNILIGSITACSSGYDFFDVDRVIALETSWSNATNVQAYLRARRFSTKIKVKEGVATKKKLEVYILNYKNELTYMKDLTKKDFHVDLQEMLYT